MRGAVWAAVAPGLGSAPSSAAPAASTGTGRSQARACRPSPPIVGDIDVSAGVFPERVDVGGEDAEAGIAARAAREELDGAQLAAEDVVDVGVDVTTEAATAALRRGSRSRRSPPPPRGRGVAYSSTGGTGSGCGGVQDGAAPEKGWLPSKQFQPKLAPRPPPRGTKSISSTARLAHVSDRQVAREAIEGEAIRVAEPVRSRSRPRPGVAPANGLSARDRVLAGQRPGRVDAQQLAEQRRRLTGRDRSGPPGGRRRPRRCRAARQAQTGAGLRCGDRVSRCGISSTIRRLSGSATSGSSAERRNSSIRR